MAMKQLLIGHTSPETAYIQPDYPYSFHLRCQRRVWLEYRPRHGYRLMTQTSNPKKSGTVGIYWNKPKASTYAFLAVMYLDEQEHVQWAGLHMYKSAVDIETFAALYGDALRGEREQSILAAMRAFAAAQAQVKYTCVVIGTAPVRMV